MKQILLTVASLSLLAVTGARASTVVGMNGVQLSAYSNPFDPNNDGVGAGTEATTMTAGAIGAGTVGVASGWSQADLVNRHDALTDAGAAAVRLQDNTGVATSAFMQFQAASSFKAGTIITYQYVLPAPYNNATPYSLKLDGTTVQSGPGILGTKPIQVTTLPSLLNASTLRVEETMSAYNNSTIHYAEMNEVVILPRRLAQVSATVTQTAGTTWFNTPQAVSDLDGYGWGGFSNPSLKLDFGHATNINTLVIANFSAGDTGGPVDFIIKNDSGTAIGHVQLDGAAYGEFLPITFATPVLTSFLTFDFTDVTNGRTGIREIMAFTDAIPEPSLIMLLGVGGLFLWRRARRK